MSSHSLISRLCSTCTFLLPCSCKTQNHSTKRKRWYQRATEMPTLWKLFSKSKEIPKEKPSLRRTLTNSTKVSASNSKSQRLKKSTSLKVTTSPTCVCLCTPISFYNDVFQSEAPPRRSYSYPRSKRIIGAKTEKFPSPRMSVEGRRIFRGKSLRDDVLMRRFVVEEEAMMQVKRRNQMEIIRKRTIMRRKKIGPSPLSRMVLAEEE